MLSPVPPTPKPTPSGAPFAISRWPGAHFGTGINPDDRPKLDRLLGMALLDDSLCRRLVQDQDESLMVAFAITKETRDWLRGLRVSNLTELAQAVAASW